MSALPVFVGIDVAKAQLDIAVRPSGERWAVANDAPAMAALVGRLQAIQPTLMVLEATGGYQRAVVAALTKAALPGVVVNPPAGPGLCQSHLAAGHNRCARRPRRGPRCRGGAPHPSPTARCADRRATCPGSATPPTDRHADGGAEPPRWGVRSPADGYPGPSHLARSASDGARRRLRDSVTGQSSLARARRVVPPCAGY